MSLTTDDLDAYLAFLTSIGGSDLHLKVGSPPCVRVDGRLQRIDGTVPVRTDELRELAQAVMPPRARERLQATRAVDFAYSVEGLARFRAHAFLQRGSVSLVLRRVGTDVVGVQELGLPSIVSTMAQRQRGLLVATGPTGSGKSTTLAAVVHEINLARECHILTIEDPIEVVHRDHKAIINQREVGEDAYDFPTALRAALRADPDVILVGEMRDAETVEVALTAAETGHLVLSTLHTIDAAETVNRIASFFPPHKVAEIRVALASTLVGTICQRLVPRVGGGRVPAVEVMVANERVRRWIVEPGGPDIQEIIEQSQFDGSQTFEASLIAQLSEGLVTLDDAMAASSNAHSLRVRLRELGLIDSRLAPVVAGR